MVLPSGRLDVTLYVLFFSTLSFFINLLSIPYNALIIAHERMNAFAYIAIVEGGLNLLMAFLLIVVPVDKLGLYAFCKVIIALTVRASMSFIARAILRSAVLFGNLTGVCSQGCSLSRDGRF